MSKKKPGTPSNTIALNKKAKHEYHIEERFEAGLALLGWEVKSLRAGKAQLVDAYVLLKDGEAWLLGSHITPLIAASSHVIADPTRTRKLQHGSSNNLCAGINSGRSPIRINNLIQPGVTNSLDSAYT